MPIYARRILKQAAKYLLIGLALLYAADWSVFEARFMLGAGLASVPVEQYLTTSLKGGKAEYDYVGTANVQNRCVPHSRSTQSHNGILPAGG